MVAVLSAILGVTQKLRRLALEHRARRPREWRDFLRDPNSVTAELRASHTWHDARSPLDLLTLAAAIELVAFQ
jgi:hypothetical protein